MKKPYLFLIVFLLIGPSMYLISYLKTRENVSNQSFIDDDDKDVSKVEGNVSKQSFIDYDAKYVSKLTGFGKFKDRKFIFKKVYETETPPITLYNPAGSEWDTDPGDFSKVQIQLENGNMVKFDNLGGWIKIEDPIKLPEQSQRVKQTPYFFTLDMGEGKYIIVLAGYAYASMPGYLTLIAVGPENAEIIFNQEFYLQEVLEEHNGYRLVVFISVQYEYGKFKHIKYEIVIHDGKLTFQEQKDQSLPKGTSP